jgi:hypothetical protein
MKLIRTLALTLGITLAGGSLAGAALADDGRDGRQHRGDRDDRDDHDDGRYGRDDGRYGRDDDGGTARWERDDDGRWDRDDRRDGRHWGHAVPVRIINHRDQWVTLYVNGRYAGRVAPNSRERIAVPAGYHTLTYQVGRRNRVHQVSLSAFHGQRNRVVIESRRGGWGRW